MGGSSGGGGSGKVDYPVHMKEFHYQALSNNGATAVITSIADLLNTAVAINPYSGILAYRGLDELNAMDTEYDKVKAIADDANGINFSSAFSTIGTKVNTKLLANPFDGKSFYKGDADLDAIDTEFDKLVAATASLDGVDWETALETVAAKIETELYSTDTIDAAVQSFIDLLNDELETRTYPAFEAGMRDINAIASSAYVIGKALIETDKTTKISQYDADLRHKAYLQKNEIAAKGVTEFLNWYLSVQEAKRNATASAIDVHNNRIAKEREYSQLTINLANESSKWEFTSTEQFVDWFTKIYEVNRTNAMLAVDVKKTRLLSEREFIEQDIKVSNIEATWEFEAFQFAGNFLASIGGGTALPASKGMSSGSSAISGALSGAGMGTQIGGTGWGTAIGAVAGGIGGLLG